jgi:uncharacterized protein (DUF983 family)
MNFEPRKKRSWRNAILRGFTGHCPSCGNGKLMASYLKVADTCTSCGTELHHQRADDAPPYFTMTIVAHLVVPGLLIAEKLWKPPLWVHGMIWLPATLLLTLCLMPRVKGAIVGLQWANRMHGFGQSIEKPAEP